MNPEHKKYDRIYGENLRYENTGELYGSICHAMKVINHIDNLKFDTVLDIGCGRGQFEKALIERGKNVSACDISGVVIEKLRESIPSANFNCASMDDLPYDDSSFDLVTSFEVLEHIPEDLLDKSLLELSRVAKGDVVASVAWHEDLKWGMHLHVIIKQKGWWVKKLSEFFDIEKILLEGPHNMFVWLKVK